MPRAGSLSLLIGPVGAGKSTFGHRKAIEVGGVFLDLDTWMVRLYGGDVRPTENVIAWYLERRDRCRHLAWDVATDILRSGVDVILELGLVTAADRTTYYEKARSEELMTRVYLIDAPRDVRRNRVMSRNQAPGPFTQVVPLEFFERASNLWEPPLAPERSEWGIIDL